MNPPAPDQSSRIALVTGASRGVGRAAALALAQSGAHIVALARTQGALEELDDEIRALRPDVESPATLVPLDLKDFAAIDRLGEALYRRWGRLDALIGNAGILGVLSPLHHVNPKDWDDVLAVNVTANWRLIRSLDPLLRRSAAGRAVFITSGAAEPGGPARLLGPVRHVEGRPRRHRADLRRRDAQHLERARHARQSRAVAHADAGEGHAGRGSRVAAHATGSCAEDRRTLLPAMDRDRQVVRLPDGFGPLLPRPRIVNGASGLRPRSGEAKTRFRSEPKPR